MNKINFIVEEIKASDIPVDKFKFSELCRTGCSVYNSKHSCPPVSPTFSHLHVPDTPFILIILYKENDIIAKQEFTKVKALNSILKAALNKLLFKYAVNPRYAKYQRDNIYGSGSCRLCRKCNYPNPCNRPNQTLYSMESVGIDVVDLCAKFGHTLCWYKRGEPYKYGTVVGMIRDADKKEVESQINIILGNDFTDVVVEDNLI
jgi:predicted metal-binding protein